MDLELKDVVSIGGRPGLHKIVGRRQNGLIVETLDDAKRRFPTTLNHKISILEDISIFTLEGDLKLEKVFSKMDVSIKGGLTLIPKNAKPEELKTFFLKVLPNYDQEQVYNSDIKKLVQWYSVLQGKLDFQKVDTKDAKKEKVAKNIKKKVVAKKTVAKPVKKVPKPVKKVRKQPAAKKK